MLGYFLIASGAAVGFAMGCRWLSHKVGCLILALVPFAIFGMLLLEPVVTGRRQSSTASLAIPVGTFWIGAAAAAGILMGLLVRWLAKRRD
ncbi:hypothetical protein OAS19_02565 [Altererythrobacter sp.]|nr:hypothetical protein [Altererythrobacter sp.]